MTLMTASMHPTKQKLLMILALCLALSLLLVDTAAIPVALPSIRNELHLTRILSQWIVNSFLLVNASLVFAGGRISDIFGHRRIFCLGLIILGVGCFFAGFSQNGLMLLLARLLQGAGGAMIGPSAYALLYDQFPIGERGQAVGLMVGISSIPVSISPFFGGYLAECFSWRWIFWLQVPLIIAAFSLALQAFPKSEKQKDTFDLPGFLSLTASFGCLTLAIMQGKDWGWFSPIVILLFIFGLLFFYLLLLSNRYVKHPFLNVFLLNDRLFSRGILLLFGVQFIMMLAVMLPSYFEAALGLTPIQAGLYMVVSSFSVMWCGPLSGYLSDHFSPKYPAIAGFSLLTLAMLVFVYLSLHSSTTGFWLGLLLYGCGVSLVMTSVSTSTLSCVSPAQTGEATGIYNSVRYTGATLGMTLMCSLSNNLSYHFFETSLQDMPQCQHLNINAIWEILSDRIHSPWLLDAQVRTSFVQSTNFAFAIICILAAFAALICLCLSLKFFREFETYMARAKLLRQRK